MEKELTEELAKFKTSSWALWSEKFNHANALESDPKKLYEHIIKNRNELKKNVVFLGLNRSEKGRELNNETFTNFHTTSHPGDGLLKKLVPQFPNLSGGYMTDFCLQIESDSSNVEVNSEEDISRLENQLSILDAQKNFLICFGNDVYEGLHSSFDEVSSPKTSFSNLEAFVKATGERTIFVCKVIHYSYAIRYGKQERLRKQLQEIDNYISKNSAT